MDGLADRILKSLEQTPEEKRRGRIKMHLARFVAKKFIEHLPIENDTERPTCFDPYTGEDISLIFLTGLEAWEETAYPEMFKFIDSLLDGGETSNRTIVAKTYDHLVNKCSSRGYWEERA